ncbi:amino acid permease [Luteitalea sp. TBR-22]|uniref:APC family permease n=1 Tax=Luteitalea sp. TBR-22 TaxID=2802971 RepID=UPI001AF09295|nr:amino acid permease [Luteitalea sp. TBR-22]BCS33124.1 amino acid permease [Luteitalea sp. TBR-22]
MSAKSLGFWQCWSLVVGGAIGSAVFMMPAVMAPYGRTGLVGLAAATAGALAIALTLGHLARRITSSGGCYAYTRAAFGDFPAFLVAWGFWISLWVSVAAMALACASYVGALVPAIAASRSVTVACGLAAVWLTVGVNCIGVRESGLVSLVTTVLKIAPLLVVGLGGLWIGEAAPLPAATVPGSPVMLLGSVFALAFWNFVGIEAATVPSEHVTNSARTVPRALLWGTLTVGAIYLLVSYVSLTRVAPDALLASRAPLADVGRQVLGPLAATVITLGAIVSVAGCLNVTMLEAGQTAMAAARDGLFPSPFARLSPQGVPAQSYIVAGGLASGLLLLNAADGLVHAFTFMGLLATLTTVVPYAAAALASLVLGRTGRTDPARSRHVAVAMCALLACAWVIASVGWSTAAWGLALLVLGVPVYVGLTLRGPGRTVAAPAPGAPPSGVVAD